MTPERIKYLRKLADTEASNFGGGQSNTAPVKTSGQGGILTSLISEGGALGGAAAGAGVGSIVPGVGTVIGGILGAGVGAFGGRLAENKVRDDRWGVGDAAKEGALSAVLAGPLKLGKYGANAAKGVKAGATLSDALVEAAAKSTVKKGVSKTVGNKLLGASDNLATRALKINDSQFATDFANRTGEEIGQFATRFGIVGKSAPEIRKSIYAPAQKVYAAGVKAIGTVPKKDVIATVRGELKPLLSSAFDEDKLFAKDVLKQANSILKKFGDDIPATELNKLKSAAYGKVNTKLMDKAGAQSNSAYETLSNAFRKAVGNAADKAGVTLDPSVLRQAGLNFKSTSLNDLGQELFGLDELIKKIDVKSRVGKGSSIFGLKGAASGAAGAATIGGPAGLAVGVGSELAANSPRVMAKTSGILDSLGSRLTSGTTKAPSPIRSGMVSGGKAVAGSSLAEALLGGSQESPLDAAMIQNMNNPSPTSMASNTIDELYQSDEQTSRFTEDQALEAMMIDIQATGGKNLEKIQSLFAFANPEPKSPKLNNTAIQSITDLQTGIDNLGLLEQNIASSNANSPFLGGIRSLIPFDTEAKSLRAEIDRVKQVVGKALEGGVLRKEDEEKYARILPTINDTDEVAMRKIAAIRADLQNKLNVYTQNQGNLGGGGSSLEEVMLQYAQ